MLRKKKQYKLLQFYNSNFHQISMFNFHPISAQFG